MKYICTTPATSLPVTLDQAKDQLNVEHTRKDTHITSLLNAAVNHVQEFTGRQLMTATWKLLLKDFEDIIEIEKLPVSAITSVEYYDDDNALQTLATSVYRTDVRTEPAIIELKDNQSWPDVYDREYAVEITFTAGYADADSVPDNIKHAIKLLVSNWYSYRDDLPKKLGMTTASQQLLAPYKIPVI